MNTKLSLLKKVKEGIRFLNYKKILLHSLFWAILIGSLNVVNYIYIEKEAELKKIRTALIRKEAKFVTGLQNPSDIDARIKTNTEIQHIRNKTEQINKQLNKLIEQKYRLKELIFVVALFLLYRFKSKKR